MTKTLETERLLLRPYGPGERAAFVSLMTDEGVMRHADRGALSEADAGALFERVFTHVYAARAFDVWGVFEKEGGAFVGHAELKPRRDALARPGDFEVVYILGRGHSGRGLATELAARIVGHGLRELRVARVCATVAPENAASTRVLEKLGMGYEGEFTDESGRALVYATGVAPAGGPTPSGEAAPAGEERAHDDEQGERGRHGGRQ